MVRQFGVLANDLFKTCVVVGMNNNGLELNDKQAVLAKHYHQFVITQLTSPN